MCYSIPGKVTKIDGRRITVEYFGEPRTVVGDTFGVQVGDYVYAQGGLIIDKIDPREAADILAFWRENFFALQERDLMLSRLELDRARVEPHLLKIFDRALAGETLTTAEIGQLLDLHDGAALRHLYAVANHLRHRLQGNSCCVHGIIEIGSHCAGACHYCGISSFNGQLERYRLDREAVLASCRTAIEDHGFKALVLQSGEDTGRSLPELAGIVAEIRRRWSVLVVVSFGDIGCAGLHTLYDAGARGVLMRFETSNPTLYSQLRPGRTLEQRLQQLRAAKEMGYLIITGGLVGLPGQTRADIANDLVLARSLEPDMHSFGPFLPHPATPLAQATRPEPAFMRQVLAVARLAEPRGVGLLVTTAFETLAPAAREDGLTAGANAVMLNVTPETVRPAYDLYPDRAHAREPIARQIEDTLALLGRLGRAPTDLGAAPPAAAHAVHLAHGEADQELPC